MHPVFQKPSSPILSPYTKYIRVVRYQNRETHVAVPAPPETAEPMPVTNIIPIGPANPLVAVVQLNIPADPRPAKAAAKVQVDWENAVLPPVPKIKAKPKATLAPPGAPVVHAPGTPPTEKARPWTRDRFWKWVATLDWRDRNDAPDTARQVALWARLSPWDQSQIRERYSELLRNLHATMAPLVWRYEMSPGFVHGFLSHIIGRGEVFYAAIAADPEFSTYLLSDASQPIEMNDFMDFHTYLHQGVPTTLILDV
jgi:hypothetical protein